MAAARVWATPRALSAALTGGGIAWAYLHWLSNNGWRVSVLMAIHVAVMVLVPALAAALVTGLRPAHSEWLTAGLAVALAVALVLAHHTYDIATYDNGREVVLAETGFVLVTTFSAGGALVLATFVAARWPALAGQPS